MEPTDKKKKQTPLEKLQSDKLQAKMRNRKAAQRLNDNFVYIQNKGGRILFSSITSSKTKPGLGDVLDIGAVILPRLWGIAKPVLLTWGIGKIQSLVLGKLLEKKKNKSNN
ncbi:MAG: hypothetical protein LBH58_05510 [Tannerellaceae bacterium]|jgi:hypothetical protein|nr:hypothetical protein [Tannerellaceae bacterium]